MTFDIIKKHVDALDPQGLLTSGAPKDKYDIESKMLAKLLTPRQSPAEMAAIMAELFAKQFSSTEFPDKYMEAARKICEELNQA